MNVGWVSQSVAALLFLLPAAIVTLLTKKGDGSVVADIPVRVPAVVAFDIATCVLLARVVPLDIAFVVSRAGWMAFGLVSVLRRKLRVVSFRRIQWPTVTTIASCGAAAFAFSAWISRNYSIWDRQFHIPLVTLIRAQKLPFLNSFQPAAVLHYHFAGDVVAAALQCFSGARLHASMALALGHDLMFALTAVCVSSWLVTQSNRRLWILPAVTALFLTGPFSLFRGGIADPTNGYSFLNLLTMSFRPHVSLAMLLLTGIMAIVFQQAERADVDSPDMTRVIALGLCLMVLGITDEPSAALAGLGLATTWIVWPRILHPRRGVGLVLLTGMAVSIVAINVAFQASLAPGGPVQVLSVVPWRSPGYIGPPISLSTRQGRFALLMDVAPYALIYIGVLGFALRSRRSSTCSVAVFTGVVLLFAVVGLTRIDVNGVHIESHRFMTICEVLLPLTAIALLARIPAAAWERMPIYAALFLSSACGIYWIQNGIGPPEEYFTNSMDCRFATGARLFDTAKPTYISRAKWFYFAGCRPIFSPGRMDFWANLYTAGPDGGRSAFATLHSSFVSSGDSLAIACPVGALADPPCRRAVERGTCEPAGTDFRLCHLTFEDREAVLRSAW